MTAPRQPSGNRPVRQPVLLGLFAGVAVGVGFLLVGVPNVELVTLVVALAGATLGALRGAAVGAVAAGIYSSLSPIGAPPLPLLVAQMLGMAGAGVLGHVLAEFLARTERPVVRMSAAGVMGALSAALYDALTSLSFAVSTNVDLWQVLLGGAFFIPLHIVAVSVSFVAVFPALAPRLRLLSRGTLVGRSALIVAVLATGWAGSDALAATAEPDSARTLPIPAAADSARMAPAGAAPDPERADTARRLLSGPPAGADAPAGALGWQRPLWIPFVWHSLDRYDWYSPRLAVREAGIGGAAVVYGEAGTSPAPLAVVDGVPWGTGHALVDDPWLVPLQGLEVAEETWFGDGLGGTGGRLGLRTADVDPGRAVSEYRGVKGRHESYMRGIHLLTPDAAWRASFAFEEVLDNEAWNWTDQPEEIFRSAVEFPGHAKVRQSRTRLVRRLDARTGLALEMSTGRITRDEAPAWGAKHKETWDTGLAATLHGERAGLAWRAVVHWRDRDVQWGARPLPEDAADRHRKLESSREGVVVSLARAPRPIAAAVATGDTTAADSAAVHGAPAAPRMPPEAARGFFLELAAHEWQVADSADTLAAFLGLAGPTASRGRSLALEVGERLSVGAVRVEAALGGRWDNRAGPAPAGRIAVSGRGERPAWRLEMARDGRAPRSDELLTPLALPAGATADVDSVWLLPNADLEHERSWRAGAVLRLRLLGTDLALDAGVRRLLGGIAWEPDATAADRGRWTNSLDLDSARLTARLARQGRFLGWGRIMVEGTWRTSEEKSGRAWRLPPREAYRLHLFWENHLFAEDGILQLGLVSTRRGSMDDPWDVTLSSPLPARTQHDLLAGIRLVGVELALAYRNLTGERTPLTAFTTSGGQEVDMRLRWAFRY